MITSFEARDFGNHLMILDDSPTDCGILKTNALEKFLIDEQFGNSSESTNVIKNRKYF